MQLQCVFQQIAEIERFSRAFQLNNLGSDVVCLEVFFSFSFFVHNIFLPLIDKHFHICVKTLNKQPNYPLTGPIASFSKEGFLL